MRDAEGYYWFVGRADDVIKSAGHLIGPFEVESALMEHPAVAEAGVIGIPEPTAGEMVKAFVALKNGIEPSEALRKELLGHARTRLGPAVAPKDIAFRAEPAEDAQRQDHAPPAEGARARACRRATSRRSKARSDEHAIDKPRPVARRTRSIFCRQMIRIRRFEEQMRRALHAGEDQRLSASLRRRGGGRRRRHPGAREARSDRRHLSRAWPCAWCAACR